MTDADTITVRNVMTKSVIAVDSSLTVNEAAKLMEDARVGAVIVMENNSAIGIVTDRDFAVKIVAHAYHITTPVKQIMSSPLLAIGPDESVWMVADLMYTRGIRKLPVIEDDQVIGIITATDLVNQLAISTDEDIRKMYHESVIKVYKKYSPYS
ncbi:CBS domain-containing protein [Candidatus Nitrosarchaeum limnium]|uniref:CBS domain protein n=1 Tax=Candidatus Nitrosarchaeum limnium BG20 TaxID=859192 RepID=S2E8B6_9ARCH|nr:CBS domain-containing protein [Candidatus Nitrosarchaeum limnium]EPA05651.1 CBS domain protein [Candidatus Nitrosarchaeum limnium BG20]